KKKYDEALTLLENVFNRDRLDIEAHMLRAEVWLAKDEVKKAVGALEGLCKIYSIVPASKYQLARAYLRDNNPAQAIIVLNQAVTLNPDHAEAILLLGELNLRAGQAQPVVASMLGLLKKRPNLDQAQLLLAAAYQSLGRLDDAAAVIRQQI